MKLKNVFLKAVLGQFIIDILITVVFYFLIPDLLNYAPYSINTFNFIKEYTGISYNTQALSMFLPYMIIMLIVLTVYLKDMLSYGKYTIEKIPNGVKDELNIRLLNTPIICYVIKLVCIPTTVIFTLLAASVSGLIILKLTIILTLFFILDGAIIYTYMKAIFKPLINKIKNFNSFM